VNHLQNKYLAGAAVAAVLLLYFFLDVRSVFFPKCPFYLLSHLYCPGCGSQRSLSALLHGNIIAALHNNFMLIVFLPLLLWSVILHFSFSDRRKVFLFYHPLFGKMVVILVISFWILRNIPIYPFNLLAPLQ
jgi:hypothetical protein